MHGVALPGHGEVRGVEGGAGVVGAIAREGIEAPAEAAVARVVLPAVHAAVEAVVADRAQAVAVSVHARVVAALAGAGLREGA